MRISQPTISGILVEMNSFTASTTVFGTFILTLCSHGINFEVSRSASDSNVVSLRLVYVGEQCRNLRALWPLTQNKLLMNFIGDRI
jgi:hypothetical protein